MIIASAPAAFGGINKEERSSPRLAVPAESIRRPLSMSLFGTALLLLSQALGVAQVPVSAQSPPSQVVAPVDSLGRDTPRGSILGFLRAIRNGNPETAVLYLQLPPKFSSHGKATRIAEDLGAILDQGLFNPNTVSNKPEGRMEDGMPSLKERAGSIHLRNGDAYDLTMVRVSDDHKQIWLISAETIALVPEMYKQVGFPEIEERLPEVFVKTSFGGVPLWKWIAAVLLFPVALALAWLITQLLAAARVLIRRRRGKAETFQPWRIVLKPLLIIIGLLLHQVMISRLGIPALYRYYYGRFGAILIVVAAALVFWRLINRATDVSHAVISQRGYLSAQSFVMLMQRLLKAVVIFACLLALLNIFGVDTKAALAGLGIGGIAIALAAQKTLENLLGGVSVIFDQVIRVGDSCKLGDRLGKVEDISLRSTRLRTQEGSLVAIPNGALATMNIENLSGRQKILFNPTFNLRYETTADQLHRVIADIRALLNSHPAIEQGNCRVRLTALSTYSLDLEIFSYVLGGDFAAFTLVREDLLLQIFAIVRDAGTDFAFPTRTLHLEEDWGLDTEKARSAKNRRGKDQKKPEISLSDYAPEDVDPLRGSLPVQPDKS